MAGRGGFGTGNSYPDAASPTEIVFGGSNQFRDDPDCRQVIPLRGRTTAPSQHFPGLVESDEFDLRTAEVNPDS